VDGNVKLERYEKSIEDINDNNVFTSISIYLNEDNKYFSYNKELGNNIFTYNIFQLMTNDTVECININTFSDKIEICLDDYECTKMIYGNIILKRTFVIK